MGLLDKLEKNESPQPEKENQISKQKAPTRLLIVTFKRNREELFSLDSEEEEQRIMEEIGQRVKDKNYGPLIIQGEKGNLKSILILDNSIRAIRLVSKEDIKDFLQLE